VPSQVVVALSVEKIPVQALTRIVMNMDRAPPAPELTPAAADEILTALFQAGATVRMAPIQLMSQVLGMTLNGQVSANGQSPLRAIGIGELWYAAPTR
jgi:hypothetical protein